MRPLRLLLDGFGSYREAAEADFSGVEFFALVGPTGSGKSTVIDGLCFALYGTVPRWGRENVISQALAPAANSCRVALVFEAAGRRYGVVRALARDKRGQVHTREARLELLDSRVPPGAPISELLESSVEQLAEGPEPIKAAVQEILGLSYEHFTQSVLLPQGRFSEFLNAKPADRQNLLVELLAFGVYEKVGQAARRRAEVAAGRQQAAKAARAELGGATQEAEASAQARVSELTALARTVHADLGALRAMAEQAGEAAVHAEAARAEVALLSGVRTPAEVPSLARRIGEADDLVAERVAQRDAAEKAEAGTQQSREALGDRAAAERLRAAYAQRADLSERLARCEQAASGARTALAGLEKSLAAADERLQQARDAYTHAERSHGAAAIAARLTVGQDCPVCLRPVTSLPAHPVPADLAEARATGERAAEEARRVRQAHDEAARQAAVASRDLEVTRAELDQVQLLLAEAPGEEVVIESLAAMAAAEAAFDQARRAVAAARRALASAESDRDSLSAQEQRARAALAATRDSVVQLGAPAVADMDLAAGWAALTGWAKAAHAERGERQLQLDQAAAALRDKATQAAAALGTLLADHGISGVTDPDRCEAAVATHAERAANALAKLRADRKKAAALDEQIRAHGEEAQVAAMLGRLLRANTFERWLCGEALDSLVAEASQVLMELSAGQYQLDRDERNELVVVDYSDAGATRPVHTLSGGETFQASLALALALSRQVIGLSAGMRDLNSMFLDEGFGTLDEDTLETVASTLERLAADSDRMVGIITHVPALAERVPVRFVVSRAGTTSRLRRERV